MYSEHQRIQEAPPLSCDGFRAIGSSSPARLPIDGGGDDAGLGIVVAERGRGGTAGGAALIGRSSIAGGALRRTPLGDVAGVGTVLERAGSVGGTGRGGIEGAGDDCRATALLRFADGEGGLLRSNGFAGAGLASESSSRSISGASDGGSDYVSQVRTSSHALPRFHHACWSSLGGGSALVGVPIGWASRLTGEAGRDRAERMTAVSPAKDDSSSLEMASLRA